MNYIDSGHVRAYQDLVAAGMHASRHPGRSPRLRRAVASSLVLMGARLMPETPAFIGDRVLVFDPPTDTETELQPAA